MQTVRYKHIAIASDDEDWIMRAVSGIELAGAHDCIESVTIDGARSHVDIVLHKDVLLLSRAERLTALTITRKLFELRFAGWDIKVGRPNLFDATRDVTVE